jgi:hypothetical protein
MLPVAPTNNDCPGCGLASGQSHADWCNIQWCAVFDTGSLYSGCEEHDLTKTNWRTCWLFRAGMDVEELFRAIAGQQSVRRFVVNLRAALDTCELDGSPINVPFASFEEAKEYASENLERIIGFISCMMDEVDMANSLEELAIWYPELVTEER